MAEISEADKQLKDEVEKLNQQRQLISTRMERKKLEIISQVGKLRPGKETWQQDGPATSSPKLRVVRADRISETEILNQCGLEGKLGRALEKQMFNGLIAAQAEDAGRSYSEGSRLLELGETLEISDNKSRYMA
ncbi:hypothetical protein [Parasitella parasitica]|uniref:Uncharacterized protein n=1 Tax=Parasitella parasitica TaxID=35722 RepID=A0A0B7MT54_9FUNG|nr:hypothetical protein [Parasitella parasitica]